MKLELKLNLACKLTLEFRVELEFKLNLEFKVNLECKLTLKFKLKLENVKTHVQYVQKLKADIKKDEDMLSQMNEKISQIEDSAKRAIATRQAANQLDRIQKWETSEDKHKTTGDTKECKKGRAKYFGAEY